jgi:hypothetical protein
MDKDRRILPCCLNETSGREVVATGRRAACCARPRGGDLSGKNGL